MEYEKLSLYAQHLSGMVRFATLSNVDENKTDYQTFYKLHDYLEKTYPRIHEVFQKKVIGKASLLYKWTSRNPAPGKKPVMLIAHQDVVPENDPALWKYPPYSGTIVGTEVWGRGSNDCKGTMLCELEALEALIASGFEADYDIYLGFGHNEEIQVPAERKGACQIAQYLKDQGVTLGAVFDEGGGPSIEKGEAFDGVRVTLFVAEKGSVDYEIFAETDGGHSMMPGRGTALGLVARAITSIEEHPLPYRLTPLTVLSFQAQARLETGRKAEVLADPEAHFDELVKLAEEDKFLDAELHTTFAATMASGSGQSNVLPIRASAVVNSRLLQGDTIESVENYIRSLLPEGAQVRHLNGNNPTPDIVPGGRVFELIEAIEKDRLGENLVMVPELLPGGTDSRNYVGICDNVYRYTGIISNGNAGPAHGINEYYDVANAPSSIAFYMEFLKRY